MCLARLLLELHKTMYLKLLHTVGTYKYYCGAQLCLTVTPWTGAHQASLSMKFSRQEYWHGLSFHSPKYFGCAALLVDS